MKARVALLALCFAGCGPITEEEGEPVGSCAIDPWKELLVVDDAVVTSEAARNDTGGALGFRHTMERIGGQDASAMTIAWLDRWASGDVTCAWLRASPHNGCDARCTTCARRDVDLARAPFRLVAIANRIDLAETSSRGIGEGRLVYALTDGPADDRRSRALPVTVIFELHLEGDQAAWASKWHALGRHGDFDGAYLDALVAITNAFVDAASLAQVRVNDLDAVMREFHLAGRSLAPAGLRRTPSPSLDGSAELGDFVTRHRDEIFADRYDLPETMLADGVRLDQRWTLPAIGEPLRTAFAAGTCNGCHGGERPAIDGGFHVSPFRAGIAKVSRFLFDPARREGDELTRRAAVLSRLACAPPAER